MPLTPAVQPGDAPLRLLALDTSTHRLSVAVSRPHADGTQGLWCHNGEGGALASSGLIAAILNLLKQADIALHDLDALVWGHGPGAFTGLRTAAAVVQGLAYGTRSARHPQGLPVLGIDTLLAVAEDARLQWVAARADGPLKVTAVLDARMDEVYAATYTFAHANRPVAVLMAGPWLLKPEQLAGHLGEPPGSHAADTEPHNMLAGNALDLYGPRLSTTGLASLSAWPTAAALLRLAPGLLAQGLAGPAATAQPLYVRDKVAQTTAERLPPRPPVADTPTTAP